jgi:hypothetical protein
MKYNFQEDDSTAQFTWQHLSWVRVMILGLFACMRPLIFNFVTMHETALSIQDKIEVLWLCTSIYVIKEVG